MEEPPPSSGDAAEENAEKANDVVEAVPEGPKDKTHVILDQDAVSPEGTSDGLMNSSAEVDAPLMVVPKEDPSIICDTPTAEPATVLAAEPAPVLLEESVTEAESAPVVTVESAAEPAAVPREESAPAPAAEPAPVPVDELTPVAEPAPVSVEEQAPVPKEEPASVPLEKPVPVLVAEPAPVLAAEPATTSEPADAAHAPESGEQDLGEVRRFELQLSYRS